MIAIAHTPRPSGAALWQKVRAIMDVILHIGAHRTATTAFQRYLRLNAPDLAAQGLHVWGPLRTRQKLFPGLMPTALATPRARDRAWAHKAQLSPGLARQGARQLLVSDENMMGFMRDNLCATRLLSRRG